MCLITEAVKHTKAAEKKLRSTTTTNTVATASLSRLEQLLGYATSNHFNSLAWLIDRFCYQPDYQSAADSYTLAADCYCEAAVLDLAKNYYDKAVECHLLQKTQADNNNNNSSSSSKLFSLYDKLVKLTDDHYSKISHYEQMLLLLPAVNGNNDVADTIKFNIANLYFENFNYREAVRFYEELAGFSRSNDTSNYSLSSVANNNGCCSNNRNKSNCYSRDSLLRLAAIYSSMANIRRLAVVYQRLMLEDQYGNYYVRFYLCQLCNGITELSGVTVPSVVELDFVSAVAAAYINSNVELLMSTVNCYSNYHFMDAVVQQLLLPKIHQHIVEEAAVLEHLSS